MNESNETKILLELSVEENHFLFASSIDNALQIAENEYLQLDEQISESFETIKKLSAECDKLDYILSATCGVLCGIIDIFLVGKPGESPVGNITDNWFEERTKDFARLCGWKDTGKENSSAIAYLEKKFKIPYDQRGSGDAGRCIFELNTINHHFKSLGHNPTLLGLFFSILDQFSAPNKSHFVTNGELITLHNADDAFELCGNDVPSKLFCAFVNWFGHLISDMSGASTSKGRGMGIPSPFWAWTNDIIAIKRKSRIPVFEFDKTINELALNIYKKGYDFRFQTTQAIVVFVNEIFVRMIFSVRRLIRYFVIVDKEERSFKRLWKECEPFSNASVKRMLTVAHGTFCLMDMSDALIKGAAKGNIAEFAMRLNIVGVGRFAISMFGEIDRSIKKKSEKENVYFLRQEKIIIEDYIEGLKYLSYIYDDRNLLTFVENLENSDTYKLAFMKSVELAKKRSVPDSEILKSKDDIDAYFKGGN
ncbi:MAG: hypothetical protein K6G26_08195 [Lachnospiraceae bacterium]|nr:hypothetical protein [Lachnospiraceae bacterium]